MFQKSIFDISEAHYLMGITSLAGAQIWQEHWDIRSGGNLLEYFRSRGRSENAIGAKLKLIAARLWHSVGDFRGRTTDRFV